MRRGLLDRGRVRPRLPGGPVGGPRGAVADDDQREAAGAPTAHGASGDIARALGGACSAAPPGDSPRRIEPATRVRVATRTEPRRVARAVEGSSRAGRRRPAMATTCRRGVLLPELVRPPVVACERPPVRARAVARIPLLLRARDVGRRDLHPPLAPLEPARCGASDPGLPKLASRRRARE